MLDLQQVLENTRLHTAEPSWGLISNSASPGQNDQTRKAHLTSHGNSAEEKQQQHHQQPTTNNQQPTRRRTSAWEVNNRK